MPAPKIPLPQLLCLKEVAARLGVSPKTVQRCVRRGELPVHRIGGQVRISESDLRGFVAQRRENG